MKVKTGSGKEEYRTVWMDGSTICLIDQRKLPQEFCIYRSNDHKTTAAAIKKMIVRGAPAIGATAAYGMAQAALESNEKTIEEFSAFMDGAGKLLKSTRPTAYDLFHAVDYMNQKIDEADSIEQAKETAKKESQAYADQSAENCRRIGEIGEKLIGDGFKILTHCNAGSLACVDYGTALAPVRFAHYNGKSIHVFVDETRPRLQGSMLTAWELLQEDIPHSIIVDNAAGYLMEKGEIDLVIVGADRIAKNGDVINKIGTYEKAVVAKENGIPFYVAAPETTFDEHAAEGSRVEIEERSQDEVLCIGNMRIAPSGSPARNPGFDITPKRYVRGVITEKGIKR